MSGFYLMHRGWRDNPVFQDEPCSEREAWIWLIEEAAYQDRRKRVGGVIVSVRRGQVAASTRFLAEAWGWTHSKARRFLDRLEKEAMVGTATDTGVTIITVCNYEKYQVPEQTAGTPTGTGPAQDRHRTGTNEKERNTGKELPIADAMGEGALADPPGGEADDLFPPPPPPKADPSGEPLAPGTGKQKPKRATRLQDDWSLPPEWRDWAINAGLDPPAVGHEAEKFADYWHSLGGEKARKIDWEATWRNWTRRALEEIGHADDRRDHNASRHPRNAWAAAAEREADLRPEAA